MEITTKDIRTGNLFLYDMGIDHEGPRWEPTRLDWQDIKWCDTYNSDFNKQHKPIPLDKNWLEKLGFYLMKNDCESPSDWYWCINGLNGAIWNLSWYYTKEHNCKIQYVHQLQNLYHAITGKELICAVTEKI